MALVSGIVTPLVVEIKDRSHPGFKKYPFKSIQDDLEGAFSCMPYNVLHNEDIVGIELSLMSTFIVVTDRVCQLV